MTCGLKNRLNKIWMPEFRYKQCRTACFGIYDALSFFLFSQEILICSLCFSFCRMTINNFSIEYDAINSKNTFTNGDTINGRIIVETSKETKIQSLVFIAQGRAQVVWHEHYGQYAHYVYWANEKYYDVKHHILREARQDGTEVIGKGRHVFPFSFQIPDRNIPSSFKDSVGKVVHKLKAELKQSMKLSKKAKTHFTFVSKADMDIPGLMEPQYGSKDKSLAVFGSGKVWMDVHTKRMGYKQGKDLQVKVEIRNHSTRPVKPKFLLYEKKSYFAQGHRKVCTKKILKEKIEAIAPSSNKTVTQVITIPRELPPSILNCSIFKLEYRLKIHLNIKCASNPEIKFPIVVLPAFEVPTEKQPPPSSGFGFEAFRSPDQAAGSMALRQQPAPGQQPVPRLQVAPQPVDPPPAYGAHAMYPSYPDSGKYQDAL
ncbi:arrestin domain-containing protein 3-like [Sparus aurata]|uniref:Arrestin domain-containing protein 3-like n=1 Tax=Sparus aurata TaxID=8175 RepID=A0A671TDT4_SPAAU|nr:arrestin domain-containing protein 3-like [Sparus aurata]